MIGPLDRFVAYAAADLAWTTGPVATDRVNRCHVVAVTAPTSRERLMATDEIVVCESVQGWRFLPGGTREAGESVEELVVRELREEAGAETLAEPRLVAGWNVMSRRATAYRAHLAHPSAVWAIAQVSVRLIEPPTCPPGGEQIVAVRRFPARQAVSWLADSDDDLHAAALDALLAVGS